jgi:PAS domain S-box-containing protein
VVGTPKKVGDNKGVNNQEPPSSFSLHLAITLISVAVLAAAYFIYSTQQQSIRGKVDREIAAIAQLKSGEISRWRAERLTYADTLTGNAFYSNWVTQWKALPTPELESTLRSRLAAEAKRYSYGDLILVDADGEVLQSLNNSVKQLSAVTVEQLGTAFREHRSVMTDLYIEPASNKPHIDIIAPLFSGQGAEEQAAGAVVFCIDPAGVLYPLIQSWPLPSRTAEIQLVEKSGDSAVFLNSLRFQPDAALKLGIPLTDTESAAVMAVTGYEGVVEGTDYRGAHVLAALQQVPDSPWFIVAKVDADEALSTWQWQSGMIIAIFITLLAAILAVIGLFWQRRQRIAYQALYQTEEELRERDEQYRLLMENAMEAIIIAEDGILKFGNRQAAELSGYTHEEFMLRRIIEFIHPDDRRMILEHYRRQISGMVVSNIYVFRFICKSGNTKWVEASVARITWEGRPATLNFLTDVTDRRRLEDERQRVAKLESVGLLAGGIAHDFNNLLTAILGNISLASMEAKPGSEMQNSLGQAEKASLRAKDLTKQLLTFSKGGAPVKTLASLPELLRDTAGFALRGSNVKCNFSIPPDLWYAEIDEGQVSQVIHNLVINAQQALPTGGAIELIAQNMALSETLSLGRGLPLDAGNYIRISVADHGSGIPAENMEKIFDPFFTTKNKGSGLGLATSFSIARRHSGHLSVESELGVGSTFYLYLPASTQKATTKQDTKKATKPVGKGRILVMDDEKGVREVAGRMLKHIGYDDVEFAADGAGAVRQYKAAMESGRPFSAAILDLTVPGGMGGKETIRKLLKIDSSIKAIVSSGYADDSVMADYRDHGFSGMVIKPYTLDELGKALHNVTGAA